MIRPPSLYFRFVYPSFIIALRRPEPEGLESRIESPSFCVCMRGWMDGGWEIHNPRKGFAKSRKPKYIFVMDSDGKNCPSAPIFATFVFPFFIFSPPSFLPFFLQLCLAQPCMALSPPICTARCVWIPSIRAWRTRIRRSSSHASIACAGHGRGEGENGFSISLSLSLPLSGAASEDCT